jgi:hypothetical protein
MKQYRITSEHFVSKGETGDADAFMDAQQLQELKKLAGLPVGIAESTGDMSQPGPVGGMLDQVPQAGENGIVSPVGTTDQANAGSNISYTAAERRELEHEYGARPGDDLWFLINFTKPYLNGSLRDHIEEYLKTHPDKRPKLLPGS